MPRSLHSITNDADEFARPADDFDPYDGEAAELPGVDHGAVWARREAERAVLDAVRGCRAHQMSWEKIGRRVNTTGPVGTRAARRRLCHSYRSS